MDEPKPPCHPHWEALLTWLASHGMQSLPLVEPRESSDGSGYGLYAVKTISPSTALFTVPASAILNISTLSRHYPPRHPNLTATQLISLHLFLYRPVGSQCSSDPLFGPYISTLPKNFDFHPLIWFCHDKGQESETQLLAALPPSAMDSLKQLAARFYTDWGTICQYLQENPNILSARNMKSAGPLLENHLWEMDYVWAWLNVNTRCVYQRLKLSRSDPDNMALCPILDFANHTPLSAHMTPLIPDSWNSKTSSYAIGGDYTLLAPAADDTQSDSELYLTYGPHCNKRLFVEYGFVNRCSEMALGHGELQGEVDVQAVTERLFKERNGLGDWMKDCLMKEGYWGDWTLHSSPPPAHPSYRLITALRLYSLFPMTVDVVPPDVGNAIQPWYDTLLGRREVISEVNETAWKEMMLSICQSVTDQATTGLAECRVKFEGCQWEKGRWIDDMKQNIEALWREELFIASGVSESVHGGVEF